MVHAKTEAEKHAWNRACLDEIRRAVLRDARSVDAVRRGDPPHAPLKCRLKVIPLEPSPRTHSFDDVFAHGMQTLLHVLRPVSGDTDEPIVPWHTFNTYVVSQRTVYLYLTVCDSLLQIEHGSST